MGAPGVGAELGPYRLQKQLGSGGMGVVFLASVTGDVPGLPIGDLVAVKVVHPHLVADMQMFERFVQEARLGRRIQHENVVRTLDAGLEIHDRGESVYLVMEHVAGETLAEMIERSGAVAEDVVRRVARGVARALCGIHSHGVVHADLKPENVLITPDGVVKVMDLGVAHLRGEALRMSTSNEFAGSLLYAAPEQLRGGAVLDPRADLYSLGVTLFHLAAGEHPFQHDDYRVVLQRQLKEEPPRLRDLRPEASDFLCELIDVLVRKMPDERIRSAEELSTILSGAEQSRWWRSRPARGNRTATGARGRLDVERPTDVHGRERELVELRARFSGACGGRGSVLLVVGEAGVGKTRLLDEFLRQLEFAPEDPHVLAGHHRRGRPGHTALVGAVRDSIGPELLRTMLGGDVGARQGALGTYESLLGLGVAAGGDAAPAAGDLDESLVGVVRTLTAQQPVVAIIEGLHEADDAGRTLFEKLARAAEDLPLTLIGTARRGLDRRWAAELLGLPHVGRMTLDRLRRGAVRAIAKQVLEGGALSDDLARGLRVRSDGNPRAALTIVSALRDEGRLQRSAGGAWTAVPPLTDEPLPAAARTLFAPRVDALAVEDRDLLEAAACIGQTFDAELLGSIAGLSRRAVLAQLARLERQHRAVRREGERYAFDSRGVWEELLGGAMESLRAEYHRMIADALAERCGGEPDGAAAADICSHRLRADEFESALPHLRAALEHLDAAGRHEELSGLADAALAAGSTLPAAARTRLLVYRALALGALGRTEPANDSLRSALESLAD